MKKLIFIVLCFFIISCKKVEIKPTIMSNKEVDIFTITESEIIDGQEIMFKLLNDSSYIIKLVDKTNNQVLSKEKIKGKIGLNKIKIYTKSLPSKYLYLVLEDVNKKEISKTTIITK